MRKLMGSAVNFLKRDCVARVIFLVVSIVLLIFIIFIVSNSPNNSTNVDTPIASDADWVPYESASQSEAPTASPSASGETPPSVPNNPDEDAIVTEPIETPTITDVPEQKLIPDASDSFDNTQSDKKKNTEEPLTEAQKLEVLNFATVNVLNSGLSDAESIILSDKDSRGNTVNIPVFIDRLQSMLELKNGYDLIISESGESEEYKEAWALFSTEATRLVNEAIENLGSEDSKDTPEDWLDLLWEYYDAFVTESNN